MDVAVILVLVGGMVGVGLIVLFGVTRLLKRQAARIVADWQAAGLTITKGPASANYRGHLKNELPVRGNGLMALTTTDLRVVRLAPRREFIVPLAQITHLAVKRVWQGSYKGIPVIGVYYRDAAGENGLGVIVANRDRQSWVEAIASAAGVSVVPD